MTNRTNENHYQFIWYGNFYTYVLYDVKVENKN